MWLAHTPPLTYGRREGGAGTALVPGLAEKVPEPSEDGLTWRFRLRDGLHYSDERRGAREPISSAASGAPAR